MVSRKFCGVLFVLCASTMLLLSCGGGVSANAPVTDPPPTPTPAPTPAPNPSPTATPTPAQMAAVQHVIVVIMQNASFDHLFGTFPAATGGTVNGLQPGVPGYSQVDAKGKTVTPFLLTTQTPAALPEGNKQYTDAMNNGLMDKYAAVEGDLSMGYYDGTIAGVSTFWSYAQQYALADNYFGSVIGEAPSNQLYMVAADDNNFPYSFQPVYGPCQKPDKAATALTFPSVGDQLTQAGIPWAVYQEDLGVCSKSNPEHDPFQYFTSTQNSSNIRDYTAFAANLASGSFPAVSFVIPNDADDLHPGHGPLTAGAAFVDTLVKQIQASSAWPNTVILVTFDDAGGWYDHVPPPAVDSQGLASRVPLLVISPLTKTQYISHVQMDHVSILRFIEEVWKLPSLNPRNDQSNDLSDFFQ